MNLIDRAKAPTPKFFKLLRSVGVALASVGGVIIGAPIVLPLVLVTAGGYILLAGTIITAVSQITVYEQSTNDDTKK